jgi:apolipoprotein N-acyltransferase
LKTQISTALIPVSLIQCNIEQDQKWALRTPLKHLLYTKALPEGAENHSDFIVWPETAVPCYFSPEHEYGLFSSGWPKGKRSDSFGSRLMSKRGSAGDYTYFNSAFLVSPEDKRVSRM